jgi:hypothetical protein
MNALILKSTALPTTWLFLWMYGFIAGIQPVLAQTVATHQLATAPTAICDQGGVPKLLISPTKGVILAEHYRKDDTYRHENVYLHCYQLQQGISKNQPCKLQWFEPITPIHATPMTYQGTYGLKSALAVVGHQNDKHHGGINTMVQFFSYEGTPIGPIQRLSCYYEPVSGFTEQYLTSANQKCLLWFSANETVKAEDRKYYCSVYSTVGRLLWSRQVRFPNFDARYKVHQVQVDDKGFPYFLLMADGNDDEKLHYLPPKLIAYDYTKQKMDEIKLYFDCTAVLDLQLLVRSSRAIWVAAQLTHGNAAGITNQRLDSPQPQKWNSMALQHLKWSETGLVVEHQRAYALPDTLQRRYKAGAHFTSSRLLADDKAVFWLFEEMKRTPGLSSRTEAGSLCLMVYDADSLGLRQTHFIAKSQSSDKHLASLSYHSFLTESGLYLTYTDVKERTHQLKRFTWHRASGLAMNRMIEEFSGQEYVFYPMHGCVLDDKRLVLLSTHTQSKSQPYNLLYIATTP